MEDVTLSRLKANVHAIQERISLAQKRAKQPHPGVTLIAVTKYVELPVINALVTIGCHHLGESRPQRIWNLAPATAGNPAWHLIGHLQTNKVRKSLPLIQSIHSLDRMPLAQIISEEAGRIGRTVDCFLEVNVSGESAKHGLSVEDARKEYLDFASLPGINVVGLMTMGVHDADDATNRQVFRTLAELRRDLDAKRPCPFLSMGMSDDFEIAIEEGATHVRVGSALFEGLLGDH